MTRRPVLALALAGICLAPAGSAEASTLPAGLPFGLECLKASFDPYNCEVALSPALDGGEAVAVSPNGRFVWAGGADGVLWTFRRGGRGLLAPVATANAIAHLGSVDGLAPSPDGRALYAIDVGSAGSGTLHVLHVRPDGTLGDGGCFDPGSACGAGNSLPALAHAADVTASGDGRNVYVAAGFGTDAVSVFTRAGDGSLTYDGCVGNTGAICATTAPGLAGAHGVDVSPQGGSVYVASTGATFGGTPDGSVAALARHGDGSLAANGCVVQSGTPSACGQSGPGLADPVALVVSSNTVYVASRDGFTGAASSVTSLRRGSGATLSFRSCFAFTGSSQCGAGRAIPGLDNAFDIVMSPDGKTVHTTALGSTGARHGAVATFARATNGALAFAGCLGQFNSTEACPRTRVIESAGEAIDVAPDGGNVYAGTGDGLAVLGRELAPGCRDAAAVVPGGRTTSVAVPCFDFNRDPLTHLPVAGPAHGELGSFDEAAGTVRYRPEAGYVGPDFLTFRARGGVLTSNVATLSLTVTNVRPRVTRLRLTRKRFRRGRKRAALTRRRKAKVGTSIRFRLSEPAKTTLSFERVLRGRKGRRRYRKVRTTVRVNGDTGGNSVRFQGRLSRRKRLRAGHYRLTVVARDKQGRRSTRRRVRFTLLR